MHVSPYANRHHYHQRLEPAQGILHGAGQDRKGFDAYNAVLGSGMQPGLVMFYAGLRAGKELLPWGEKIRAFLQDEGRPPLLPQIGLSMTRDGTPEEHYEHEVLAGLHDRALDYLAEALLSWKRPLFLRIGYEFNGAWNGYQKETFGPAFRYVVTHLRRAGVPFAAVWCAAMEGERDIMPYYPGDEWVDWWGIDLFSTDQLDPQDAFYTLAHRHRKPVMIGESTPRYVGTLKGQESWDEWFAPYFKIMQKQAGIKAFCYINWDWSPYPMWHNWGDGRLEMNETVAGLYGKEMRHRDFLHANHPSLRQWAEPSPNEPSTGPVDDLLFDHG